MRSSNVAAVLAFALVALAQGACTEVRLRYTFRDPARVTPYSGRRTLVIWPGRTTPRGPDGSPRLTMPVSFDHWESAGTIQYVLPDGTTAGTEQRFFNMPTEQTIVTDWDNVQIEELREMKTGPGWIVVLTAVCLSPFLMLESVDANGPFGYTLLGMAAGGVAFELWPSSTTTLWQSPP